MGKILINVTIHALVETIYFGFWIHSGCSAAGYLEVRSITNVHKCDIRLEVSSIVEELCEYEYRFTFSAVSLTTYEEWLSLYVKLHRDNKLTDRFQLLIRFRPLYKNGLGMPKSSSASNSVYASRVFQTVPLVQMRADMVLEPIYIKKITKLKCLALTFD